MTPKVVHFWIVTTATFPAWSCPWQCPARFGSFVPHATSRFESEIIATLSSTYLVEYVVTVSTKENKRNSPKLFSFSRPPLLSICLNYLN